MTKVLKGRAGRILLPVFVVSVACLLWIFLGGDTAQKEILLPGPSGNQVIASEVSGSTRPAELDSTGGAPEREIAQVKRSVVEDLAASTKGSLIDEPESGLRWIEGRLYLPEGAAFDPTAQVLSITAPERDRSRSGLMQAFMRETEKDRADTVQGDILYASAVNADGSFRVGCREGAEWGYLALEAEYMYLEEPMTVRLEGKETQVELFPRLGSLLRGRLIVPREASAMEANLAGCLVRLTRDPDDEARMMRTMFGGEEDEAAPGRYAQVSSDGRFEFRGVNPSGDRWVVAQPQLLASKVSDELDFKAGELLEVEMELVRGSTVSGRVLDSNNRPVFNAKLYVSPMSSEGLSLEAASLLELEGYSQGDGEFRIGGLHAGRIKIHAEKDGYRNSSRKKVELEIGQEVEGLELVMRLGEGLRGVVRWSDGSPAAGATVEIGRDPSESSTQLPKSMRTQYAEVEADSAGRFSVTGLKRRPQSIWAWATRQEGSRWMQGSIHLPSQRPSDKETQVVLVSNEVLGGWVRDEFDQPIERFQLLLRPDTGQGSMISGMMSERQLDQRDLESPDGYFLLDRLGHGDWSLTVEAEGYATSEPIGIRLPIEADTPDLVVTLLPFAGLSGIVLSPDGKPQEGAEVSLRQQGWDQGDMLLGEMLPQSTAKTNSRGEFALPQVEPGDVVMVAKHDDWISSLPLELAVERGAELAAVSLTLRRGASLAGVVLDAEGGPMEGLRVNYRAHETEGGIFSGRRWEGTSTDANGEFVFERLEPGTATISVRKNEKLIRAEIEAGGDPKLLWSSQMSTVVELVDGERTKITLGGPNEIGPGVQVSGHVRRRGEPLQATLQFEALQVGGSLSRIDAKCGIDGQFSVELPIAGDYEVTIRANDESHAIFHRIPATGEDSLAINLPSGTISGRVLNDGKPAKDVPLSLKVLGLSSSSTRSSQMGFRGDNVRSDDEGRFSFDSLPPGEYAVTAGNAMLNMFLGSNTGIGRHSSETIVLIEDQDVFGIELNVGDPCNLEGLVTQGNGDPVSGVSVFLFDENGRPLDSISSTSSNSAGRFRYEGIPEGNYTVLARNKILVGDSSRAVNIRKGSDASVTLRLEEGAFMSVGMQDKNGEAVRCDLAVYDSEGRQLNHLTSFSGMGAFFSSGEQGMLEHELGPLVEGNYRIVARSMDGRTLERDVVLLEGEMEEVQFELP